MRYYLLCVVALLPSCTTPAQDLRALLTRAQLNQVTEPLLFAEFEDSGLAATLTRTNQTTDYAIWETGDGVSLTFREAFLVSTRGIGDDLMSADVEAGISGTAADYYTKFHSYIDGENQTLFKSFQCKLVGSELESIQIFGRAHLTTRVDENCYSLDGDVVNTFWRGADGVIWRAKQWVSPSAGYLLTERLVR